MGLIAMSERDLQRIEVLSKVVDGRMRLERHAISASHETVYTFAIPQTVMRCQTWSWSPHYSGCNILYRPGVVAKHEQFGHGVLSHPVSEEVRKGPRSVTG